MLKLIKLFRILILFFFYVIYKKKNNQCLPQDWRLSEVGKYNSNRRLPITELDQQIFERLDNYILTSDESWINDSLDLLREESQENQNRNNDLLNLVESLANDINNDRNTKIKENDGVPGFSSEYGRKTVEQLKLEEANTNFFPNPEELKIEKENNKNLKDAFTQTIQETNDKINETEEVVELITENSFNSIWFGLIIGIVIGGSLFYLYNRISSYNQNVVNNEHNFFINMGRGVHRLAFLSSKNHIFNFRDIVASQPNLLFENIIKNTISWARRQPRLFLNNTYNYFINSFLFRYYNWYRDHINLNWPGYGLISILIKQIWKFYIKYIKK